MDEVQIASMELDILHALVRGEGGVQFSESSKQVHVPIRVIEPVAQKPKLQWMFGLDSFIKLYLDPKGT